jgi:hypothetical protein
MVSLAQRNGSCFDEKVVQTVQGWRKERELIRSKPQSASMAARFRNPSEKGVRGLSPKALMTIAGRKISKKIFPFVSFECDPLNERVGQGKSDRGSRFF